MIQLTPPSTIGLPSSTSETFYTPASLMLGCYLITLPGFADGSIDVVGTEERQVLREGIGAISYRQDGRLVGQDGMDGGLIILIRPWNNYKFGNKSNLKGVWDGAGKKRKRWRKGEWTLIGDCQCSVGGGQRGRGLLT